MKYSLQTRLNSKKKVIQFFFIVASCILPTLIFAQIPPKKFTKENLASQLKAFIERDTISYDIIYTYSEEQNPDTILDSLKGRVEKQNKNFRVQLGASHIIGLDSLIVTLFDDEKILYLSKPSTSGLINNGIFYDSSFVLFKNTLLTQQDRDSQYVFTFTFQPNELYKSVIISIDKASNYILKIDYLVKESELASAESNKMKTDVYALVSAKLFNYRSNFKVADSVFRSATYLEKENGRFKVSNNYKDFKLFIGSPNL